MMARIPQGYVETAAGQLHYRSAGDRTAPSLLLLHQTASSSAMDEALQKPHSTIRCQP